MFSSVVGSPSVGSVVSIGIDSLAGTISTKMPAVDSSVDPSSEIALAESAHVPDAGSDQSKVKNGEEASNVWPARVVAPIERSSA